MKPQTIILMGRAGSGKGTQSALLGEALKRLSEREVFYLEVGSKFRELVNGDSYTGQSLKKAINEGKLMPSFLAVWNWSSSLLEGVKTGEEHIIADGTPRMLSEADMFMQAMDLYTRHPVILHLNVPDEEVTTRLTLRARHDDTPEGIATRLKAFEEETRPVIDYFKSSPKVVFLEIDGHQAIAEVHKTIMDALTPYLND